MSTWLDTQTPQLTANDSRGLPVREIAYWREDLGKPDARFTLAQHDVAGRLVAQQDPRLMADASAPANLVSIYSLSGKVLSTVSVDAGWRVGLLGEAEQAVFGWDGRGSQRSTQYDDLVRPIAVFELAGDADFLCTERLDYGGNDPAFSARNQCGQLIRHDDAAGTKLFEQFGLAGEVLKQTRRFLRTLESPDWPAPVSERDTLLEPGAGFTARARFNPLAEAIEQTDARGNRQMLSHTVDGLLREVSLQLAKDVTPKVLVSAIQYNAHGQTVRETAGNGVITLLEYAAEDSRLSRLQAKRGNDALQDLRYAYDPVGNVLSIEDAALPVRYFANQRVEPVNRYVYDSLYQLVKATGWEAGGSNQGPTFSRFDDPASCANYSQSYRYDRGGNLLELTHDGPQSHGHRLVAAAQSNRCLPVINGVEPSEEDFRNSFDANGNLLNLQPGRVLRWDLRNQLREVRPAANDRERYAYGADGMRVRKVRSTQTNARTLNSEVRRLPGLELRTHSGTGEALQVITVQTGRSSVRVLHWESEPPKDISNDQYRYSLNDHLGSCALELDSSGDIISQERYHPFGTTAWFAGRGEVEASYKTVRYSGQERDATGLYYYGFRYYVPWLQRWLNADPAGDVSGLNLYEFCGNNTISRIDPDGCMWQDADDGLQDVLEQFLNGESDLRGAYGMAPFSFRRSDGGNDDSMDDQQSLDSFQGSDSPTASMPATPDSPNSQSARTVEQDKILELLKKAAPELRYGWNSRNLVARDNFSGKVYRADRRSPDDVLRDGFTPSDEFTAVKKMISGNALIVAETLEGALFYAAQSGSTYNFYEIDAADVRGVSLLENLALNSTFMIAHLDAYIDSSPSNQTGEANKMHEAHISHDDLTHLGRAIVSLGTLPKEVQRLRLMMNA